MAFAAGATGLLPFHPARLVARHDAGGGLTRMTVEAEREVVATYDSPGQYIEVRVEGETGFFVLANLPGASGWELVMRAGGGASDVLLTLVPGALLEVTGAIGLGFPMREARGNPVIVALGGTGIAAGPPIVGRRVTEGDATRTRVLVGIRTSGELAMRGDLEGWILAGVDVLVCLSKDDGQIEGIPYTYGYVQDMIRRNAGARLSPECRIFVVGTASMVDALKSVAPELGIAADHVHTNH
jgi:NAD(P)H-flavin reductase